jgi:integrase
MGKKLTATAVEKMKPGEARREVPDGQIPGLYLIVQPSGAKSWAVRYRSGGVSRKLTLGKFPKLGLTAARRAAQSATLAVSEGRDPADEKREARERVAEDSVPAVVDLFIARHVQPNNRSASEVQRILKREVITVWPRKSIHEIGRRDVLRLIDGIVDRGAPFMANRVFAALRKMFNWAVERGIIDTSPCAGLKPPAAETSRDRVLSDDEIRAFWQATETAGYPFGPLFRLLLLTGQRREEVAGMRWSEIDLRNAMWRIPKERSKNGRAHDVPLPSPAVDILRGLPRIDCCDLVFTTTARTAVSGHSKAKKRLDAAMHDLAGIETTAWRLHDLRRTVASGMARLGINLPIIEKVLNHVSGSFRGIVGVYQRHEFSEEKRTALEQWARHVQALVQGVGADELVVPSGAGGTH